MKQLSKIFLLLGLCSLAHTSAKAQTNVSGGIFTNTTWTLAGSPYTVIDTVVVFPGVTLTIQPGVTVKFAANKRLEIRNAKIIAIGTSTDSISFTSNLSSASAGAWANIYLNQIHNSAFSYCNFHYAQKALYGDYYGDTVRIDRCSFTHNIYGIYTYSYSLQNYITNSDFRNNSTGIYGHEYIFADNCNCSRNQSGINAWGLSRITNSILDSNTIEGLNISAWNDTILNCRIRYNGTGITDYAMGPANYISQNYIENNSYGIKLSGSSDYISCNRICNSTNYNLYYTATFNHFPMGNNYWCSTDSTTVENSVYDGYDNISYGLVDFMPLDTTSCYLSGCNLAVSTIVTNAGCGSCNDGTAYSSVINGYPPYTYTWYTSPIQTTPNVINLLPGTYQLCVTDSRGCSVCDSVLIDSTNCGGYSVSAGAQNTTCTTCSDGVAFVTISGGTAPFSYTWYTSPIQTLDTISGLAQGTYGVCVTDAHGCNVCDSAMVSTGNCSAHFDLYPDSVPHYYTAVNMASGTGPLTYLWSWGDGSNSYIPYPNHTYSATGFYTICLSIYDSTGCTSTYCSSYYLHSPASTMAFVNVVAAAPTGIPAQEIKPIIRLFPDPVLTNLTVSAEGSAITLVKVYTIMGQEVKEIRNNAPTVPMIIDMTELNKGIYFIQLFTDKGTATRKIVRE